MKLFTSNFRPSALRRGLFFGACAALLSGGGLQAAVTLDASGSPALMPVARDFTTSPGTRVRDFIETAGNKLVVSGAGTSKGIAVTAVNNANGTWQYAANGTTWSAFGTPSVASARLLSADADTRVRFVPNAGFTGVVTLSYRGWDGTGGTEGNTADAGSGATFSTTTEDASLRVGAPYDPGSTASAATNFAVNTLYDVSIFQLTNGNILSLGRADPSVNASPYRLTIRQPDFTLVSAADTTLFGGYRSTVVAAPLAGGGFVAVWSDGSSTSSAGLNLDGTNDIGARFRLYDNSGNVVGSATRALTTLTAGAQFLCKVCPLANGGFMAVWVDQSGTDQTVRVRRFDADGNALDPVELDVPAQGGDAVTGISRRHGDVGLLSNGNVACFWSSSQSTARQSYLTIIDADGNFLDEPGGTAGHKHIPVSAIYASAVNHGRVVGLSNGGVVNTFQEQTDVPPTTNANFRSQAFRVWSAALSAVTTTTLEINGSNPNYHHFGSANMPHPIVGLIGGGFVLPRFDTATNNFQYGLFDNSGAGPAVGAFTTAGTAAVVGTGTPGGGFHLQSGGFGLRWADSSGNLVVKLFQVTAPVSTAPEIAVTETGVGAVADGGSFSFGTTTVGTPVTKTFTVTNSGDAILNLSGLTLPTGFTVAAGFGSATVAGGGGTTTFQITMLAGAAATPSGTLSFTTDDADENPYNFTISGTVNAAPSLVVIQPTAVLANPPLFGTYVAANSINKVGLSPTYTSGVTDFTTYVAANPVQDTNSAILTTYVLSADNTPTGDWDYDLGATYSLNRFLFWNTQNDLTTYVKTFEIFVDDNAAFSSPESAGSFTAFSTITGSADYPSPLEVFTLTQRTGRYVRFRVLSNNSSAAPNRHLFGELAFAGTAAAPPPAPEIAVTETGVGAVADGGSFSFGTTPVGTPVTKTFTVTNSGTATLNLSGLTVPSGFTIAAGFGSSTVASGGGTTTFQITMSAGAAATPSGTLTFVTDDADENPYNFTISGTVNAAPPAGVAHIGTDAYVVGADSIASYTVPSGTNRLLLLTVSHADTTEATAATAVTFNSQALTQVAIKKDGAAVDSIWARVLGDGAAITGPIAVTRHASMGIKLTAFLSAQSFENVDQTTPTSGATTANNPSTTNASTTINVPSAAGDMVLDLWDIWKGGSAVTFSPNASQTLLNKSNSITLNTTIAGYTGFVGYGTSVKPGAAGTVGMNWTSNAEAYITVGLNIKQAAGGGGAPEIAVSETGVGNVADGGSFSFGTTTVGTPVTKTFTVTNSGTATLNLSGLTVPSGFTIAAGFGSATVAAGGGTTTFQITMSAGAAATPSGSLSFTNNDSDENPYNFTISGTVNPPPPVAVSSLVRAGSTPTNAATVNWTLTFASAVTGVTASNFTLTGPAAAGAGVGTPATSNGGLTWTIPVTTGGTDGILTLNLANATGLSAPVSTTLPYSQESYTMDKTPPSVLSVTRLTPSGQGTNLTTMTFRVTYSEPMVLTAPETGHFAVIPVGGSTIVGSVTGVTGTGDKRDVTVSLSSGLGEFRLRVLD